MKRFLLWLLGVLLGVVLFVGIVVGVSWYSVGESNLPDSEGVTFTGVPLEKNGYCWQVPLIGALADRVFAQSNTLSVQKLGDISDARPELTVPDWADPAQVALTIHHKESEQVVFEGSLAEYQDFHFQQNGTYDVEMQLWRLPAGVEKSMLAEPTAKVAKNPRAEQPARPMGWYGYRFSFTMEATPQVSFSAEQIRQGDAVAVFVTGLLGDTPPVLKSELGSVQFQPDGSGWLGYLGAAYNADAKKHTITVSMGDVETQVELRVKERSFGTAEALPETDVPEGAEQEFRDVIWRLYGAPSGPRQWVVAWEKPVQYDSILIGYGMQKVRDGQVGGKSNSTVFATTPGTSVITPTAGTVVYAGELKLTGNTVVIDHGCGVRSYIYGLADISVSEGDQLALNNPIGTAAETLTLDVKIGKKSIDPFELFNGNGGLFAKE